VKLNPIQYRLYLHPVSPPLALEILVDLHNAKKENGMLYFQVPSGKNSQALNVPIGLTGTHRFWALPGFQWVTGPSLGPLLI
jgi:hypothetical protein